MSESTGGNDDWAVFAGIARERDGALFLDRGTGGAEFEIRGEWLERVRPTTNANRSILLDAAVYLPLSVGSVTDEEASLLAPTGLKWPK